ncbi:hypothetical protein NL676_022127 [Syzygium grande]|nr:hypothetical protein NL676_022127 [Syzygium grande]
MGSRGRVPRGGEGDSEIRGKSRRDRAKLQRNRGALESGKTVTGACFGFYPHVDLPHAAWQVGGFSHFGFALIRSRSHTSRSRPTGGPGGRASCRDRVGTGSRCRILPLPKWRHRRHSFRLRVCAYSMRPSIRVNL